jgi:hypothetical protein
MHRSSETIASLAALAKAEVAGTLPGRVRPARPHLLLASLSSGLDIVRKALGQHEIATMQTTAIDQATRRSLVRGGGSHRTGR